MLDTQRHVVQQLGLACQNNGTIFRKIGIEEPEFPQGQHVYQVGGINGEVLLRKMEPFFYMTDDPAIWKELGVEQGQR